MSPIPPPARFQPGFRPDPDDPGRDAWLLILSDGRLLVAEDQRQAAILRGDPDDPGLEVGARQYLGRLDGKPLWALAAPAGAAAPQGHDWLGLRQLYFSLGEDLFTLVGRAKHLLEWDTATRFCRACGRELTPHGEERAKLCPGCGHTAFPRLSPAVIMSVEREGRILLARSPRFPGGMYSTLAGFVEPGETLEETVVREVREEVGVEVTDVRYFGSQPWPFPDSLMIGFSARWASGEIAMDDREIEAADWFAPDNLPKIPQGYAIARRLIDDFLARQGR